MAIVNLKTLSNNIDTLKQQGMTWAEITVELNKMFNVSYGESAYRKPYRAYKQGVKDSVTEDELTSKMYELEKKKKQISIERSIARADVRDVGIREMFYESIADSVSNLPALPKPQEIKFRKKNIHDDYIIALGDYHYKGDKDKLIKDMRKVEREIVEFIVEKGAKEVTILELGDTIDGGSLRPSQLMALKLGMVDQSIDVAEAISNLLSNIQKRTGAFINFGIVTSSNHTELRPLNTKRKELVEEDMMKVIAQFIELRLKDEKHISITKDKHIMFQNGRNKFVVGHGDTGNMTPNKLIEYSKSIDSYYRYNADFFIFGHYHHYLETTLNTNDGKDRKAFLNPSLGGGVDFYEERNLLGGQGGFTIMTFDDSGHKETKHVKV